MLNTENMELKMWSSGYVLVKMNEKHIKTRKNWNYTDNEVIAIDNITSGTEVVKLKK